LDASGHLSKSRLILNSLTSEGPTLVIPAPLDRYALAEIASDKTVLGELLQVSSAIGGIHDTESRLDRLLEAIFQQIPAEYGGFAGEKKECWGTGDGSFTWISTAK